jgi:hypothetical protein
LKAVEADFLDFDDPYHGIPDGCGIGWNEPGFQAKGGGAKCGMGFRKTANPTHPLRLYFGFDWGLNRPQKNLITIHSGPIPPPFGYENVSMEAPKDFGPDSMVDILRSKGVGIGDDKGGIPQDVHFGRASPNKSPHSSSPASRIPPSDKEEKQRSSLWWWTFAGLGLTAILTFAIRRWLKSRG